ncbi:hypothetical protein VTL71DRAFT_9984 [Oculimacula yallundae]|uniref:Uncharacterized protein n=1 Tax=Oculimacula yallundae TaxID=86028 RepID=A0ABR4BPZ4_9HELO
MSESSMKARHLRFVKGKRMRLARDLFERDNSKEEDEDSESSDSEEEVSSTKTKPASATTNTLDNASATATAFTTSVTAASTSSLGEAAAAPIEKTSAISSGSLTAAIIIPILGLAAIVAFALWAFRRRQRATTIDNKNNNNDAKGPARESRFWGGSTTAGTLTEVNFPVSQIPASMQPGGKDFNPTNYPYPGVHGPHLSNRSHPGPQHLATQQPFPLTADRNVDDAFSGDPFKNRVSINEQSFQLMATNPRPEMRASIATTVPQFRNVTSWAQDQRLRTAREDGGVPATPHHMI